MTACQPLTREQIAAVTRLFLEPGWIVNLGVGIPVLVSNFVDAESGIVLTSENGLIGYGMRAPEGEEDFSVVSPGMEYVTLHPGAAIVHHADAFALIRSGRVDCSVLGAYEVAPDGSFANYRLTEGPWDNLGGIGGAMDLAQGAKQIYLAMHHTTPDGRPRLVERCALPITGRGRVRLIVTDLAVVAVRDGRFELLQHAPGYTAADIQAVTAAPLAVSPSFGPMGV